jgi:hypothetical protein
MSYLLKDIQKKKKKSQRTYNYYLKHSFLQAIVSADFEIVKQLTAIDLIISTFVYRTVHQKKAGKKHTKHENIDLVYPTVGIYLNSCAFSSSSLFS